MGHSLCRESGMGLKAKIAPSSHLVHYSPRSAQYGLVPASPPPLLQPPHPFPPSPCLGAESLSFQPLTLTSPPCQTQHPLPLSPPCFSLCPPFSFGICRGFWDGLPDVRSRLHCFLGEGRRLGSAPSVGPGADCGALPGLLPGLRCWVGSGREREELGWSLVPAPLCGIVFPTLVLIFLPIAIFSKQSL